MDNKSKTINRNLNNIPMESRVASLFIHVTDLQKSAGWYSKLLGLKVKEERLNSGPVYWLELPEAHLILDSNTENRKNLEWREEMKPRFMFACQDIDEAYHYIEQKAQPFSEPERHGSMAFFNFRDPEGNTFMACCSPDSDEDSTMTAAACSSPILPRISGVFIDVKDMNSAARWYTDLLGLPFNEKETDSPIYNLQVTKGPVLLLDQHRYLRHENFTELCYFETDDIHAAYAYSLQQGFEVAGEPNHFHDLSEFTVIDPDGNRIVIACMRN